MKKMGMKRNQTKRGRNNFLKKKETPPPHQKTCLKENCTDDGS